MAAKTKSTSDQSSATIGKTVDDTMVTIHRDNPRLKGVLSEECRRPGLDKQRLVGISPPTRAASTIPPAAPATTNSRMELHRSIEDLNALKEPCAVELFTNSGNVKNGVTTWLANWKLNGLQTKSKKPVKNEKLWRALDTAFSRHKVQLHWLKSNSGHDGNERCDMLANEAIAKFKKTFSSEQLKVALTQFNSSNHGDRSRNDFSGD